MLGCTHYPMLTGLLSVVMGDSVTLVSSAEETAKDVYRTLLVHDLLRSDDAPPPHHEFRATGPAEPFDRLSRAVPRNQRTGRLGDRVATPSGERYETDRAGVFGQHARAGLAGLGLPAGGRRLPRGARPGPRDLRRAAAPRRGRATSTRSSSRTCTRTISSTSPPTSCPCATARTATPVRTAGGCRSSVRPAPATGSRSRTTRWCESSACTSCSLRHAHRRRARPVPGELRADEPPGAHQRDPARARRPFAGLLRRHRRERRLVALAAGADVLLCEATMGPDDPRHPQSAPDRAQAGEHAGPRRGRPADRHTRAAVGLAARSRPSRRPALSTAPSRSPEPTPTSKSEI